jgi:hypothetical protein
MPGRERDPNIGPEDAHPGAPPEHRKERIAEDRTPAEKKPRMPVGNGQVPDEPAAFPPHP